MCADQVVRGRMPKHELGELLEALGLDSTAQVIDEAYDERLRSNEYMQTFSILDQFKD